MFSREEEAPRRRGYANSHWPFRMASLPAMAAANAFLFDMATVV